MNRFIIPDHRTLAEIYPDVDTFLIDYQNNGIPTKITDESAKTLYYLLMAKYGSWQIASDTSDVFSVKLFAIVFQYGPSWEKRLEIQDKLRALTEDEIRTGTKAIYNQALNPGTEPSTGSLEELPAITSQNTTGYKKSKMDAYANLWELIKTDVTGEFLMKFKPLFSKFVLGSPRIYIDEEEYNE